MHTSASQNVAVVDEFINKHIQPIVEDVTYFGNSLTEATLSQEERTILLQSMQQYFDTSKGLVSSFIGTGNGEMIQIPNLGLSGKKRISIHVHGIGTRTPLKHKEKLLYLTHTNLLQQVTGL